MERIGPIIAARKKVYTDAQGMIAKVRHLTEGQTATVEEAVLLLQKLRAEIYEDMNQIQHEFAILCAVEWPTNSERVPRGTIWLWNPRQTGRADEPDLRGQVNSAPVLSAEITTSKRADGTIATRMDSTLQKLSRMEGDKFYFVQTEHMLQRAHTKIRKGSLPIEPILLPNSGLLAAA